MLKGLRRPNDALTLMHAQISYQPCIHAYSYPKLLIIGPIKDKTSACCKFKIAMIYFATCSNSCQ
jgi:hypothetical protein